MTRASAVIELVDVGARSLDHLAPVVGEQIVAQTDAALRALAEQTTGRAVWNVNSTAHGGGVAEMLRPMLAYLRGAGCDARWATIGGDDRFFRITKRLHHALHGANGDGIDLGEAEQQHYDQVLARNAQELSGLLRPHDLVLLHDPQTAGLIPHVLKAGCTAIWRCHIGHESTNEHTELGWAFLRPFLEGAHAYVFSRRSYVPASVPMERCFLIAPSIDPLSPKNQPLDDSTVRAVLLHTGLIDGAGPSEPRTFRREDGSRGRVDRRADVLRLGPAPAPDVPLVVQVSRWDTLKDPIGVLEGFARLIDGSAPRGAELMLAGPNVHAVADDPEGAEVFDSVVSAWRALPHGLRQKVHLANLPMADVEENACIVNALQRHAAIVVQKSLREGFGLTVTEAMWKARPVVASRVGGIQDQIEHGRSGVLVDDPTDRDAFAAALRGLLEDPERARRLGQAAEQRAREHFLCDRHFRQYVALLGQLDR